MIDGVQVKKLRPIADERGKLMEILRCDDPFFQKFGQVYLTTAYPGVVKAWHYHKKQTDHFCVVKGMMKVVLYDDREGSPTRGEANEFFLGEDNPLLVAIPPGVYHGMKGIGTEQAYLINCPTEPYSPAEPDEYRLDPFANSIPYDWALKNK
ncbi:MAG TPA: dTDP-4-dehydrorhamnose 3,5-epimerase family protein [Planctomycetota bacterium]|nr:dTDP-4-dehydrorhamnose 3,5-epimerase family protein [Planctomycetota bacterium]HRR81536.1 dTDP-4-dehydrorhamnose 3,5-epimerase family protein [Planctomycetota bacterium]HRT94924.1 dTDP-4-dehydrorhamnose 3,5-epimerase family protein [Planctomycetota bacterium]